MKVNISKLPYRQGVQVYIFNSKHELLLIADPWHDKKLFWKFPCGGREGRETLESTAKREMKEELGVNIEILKKSPLKNKFLWPAKILKVYNYAYKGQEQQIFVARIKRNQTIKKNIKEVKSFKWIKIDKIENHLKYPQQKRLVKKVIEEYLKL